MKNCETQAIGPNFILKRNLPTKSWLLIGGPGPGAMTADRYCKEKRLSRFVEEQPRLVNPASPTRLRQSAY